ncbi:MAG TPA: hypothetical protein VES88_04050 [Gemmatimonadaceae bacterium]|nr:hypothetical protein [Gemmatimonadaceae bacterium]
MGRAAFVQDCSTCHASGDGFDLKTFSFSDTTIIRRAVKHVDTATAHNIVAYIQSIAAPRNDENLRLFQPKGAPLAGDVEFATALFGRDAWPAELTSAELAAIDPRRVQVAIRLPVWSDEGSNTDWMPDFALPAGVLDYSGGLAAGAIAGYRASPTSENLGRAVKALRTADRASANVAAPCILDDAARAKFRECFEVRRWTSSLVALHMLRYGVNADLGTQAHDVWWDVGDAARKSRGVAGVPIANATENWTSWMFLGWSFDPSRHSSTYTAGGFRQLGLSRHATFVALRSQVARPRNSVNVYEDLLNAVRFAPSGWTLPVASFALRNVGSRLAQGDRPSLTDIAKAIASVYGALAEANKKVPVGDRATLDALGQPVLAALAPH